MKEEIQSAGNFIFDLILTNLMTIVLSIVSMGTLCLPVMVLFANEMDNNHFQEDKQGSLFSGFQTLKTNFFTILINGIINVLVAGILLLFSLSISSSFGLISIFINSFIIIFEISFWVIFFEYKYTNTHQYMLAFIIAIRNIIIGFIAYITLLMLILSFVSGAFYFLFFMPTGYILVLVIIQKKRISKYLKKIAGDNYETV